MSPHPFNLPAAACAAALIAAATPAQATSLWNFAVDGSIASVTQYTAIPDGTYTQVSLDSALGYSVDDAVAAYVTCDADLGVVLPPQVPNAYHNDAIQEIAVKANGSIMFHAPPSTRARSPSGATAPAQQPSVWPSAACSKTLT